MPEPHDPPRCRCALPGAPGTPVAEQPADRYVVNLKTGESWYETDAPRRSISELARDQTLAGEPMPDYAEIGCA